MSNKIKETAKELGMTQKQLAQHIGVSEDTVSNWSRGVVDTPKWALKMFELLKNEQKSNNMNNTLDDIVNMVKSLKTE